MWKLFLDDERMPVDPQNWVICRNIDDVTREIIERGSMPVFVSFDHDLGEPWLERGDGMKVARHLCDVDLYTSVRFPNGFDWYVHSQNPVGRDNINAFMRNYMNFRPVDHEAQVEQLALIQAQRELHRKFDKLLGD